MRPKSTRQAPPRRPLQNDQNESPAASNAARVLKKAIKGLSKDKLCLYLSNIVDEYPHTAQQLEKQLLVKGKDVVRYHADPKSEDECDPDEQGGDLEERHAIAVADEDFTPRYAQCLSCKEEFDVSENAKGSCCWHSGAKSVYFDSDFWADHDVDCHGAYELFENDSDFAEGFKWDCCEQNGDNQGCKRTKHKAKVNMIVPRTGLISGTKRKAEAELR